MKKDKLLIYGMVIGFIAGILSGYYTPALALKLAVLGTVFMSALKMVVLPLIIVAVINSILKIGNLSLFGRLGFRTMIYYIATTALSVAIGLLIAIIIQPGAGVTAVLTEVPEVVQGKEKISIVDMLVSLVPGNIFKAAVDFKVLPLIIVSLVFGTAFLTVSKGKGVLVELFDQLDKAVMLVVNWVILFTPIGIFAIVGNNVASAGGDFLTVLSGLSKYVLALLGSLGIHAIIVLPLIYFAVTKANPFKYFLALREALLMAFATASSSATLPLTRKCCIEHTDASEETADFVLPLGATVNMDGTALYEGVAVVFICQAYGIALGPVEYLTIFITAILAGVGAAAIPQAGLVTMVVVLKAVGGPIEGIGLLLAIDWLMDRFRTTVNVWGDGVGVAVIQKLSDRLTHKAAPSGEPQGAGPNK